MDWNTVIQLAVQIGWPAAQKLIDNYHNDVPFTKEEWNKIRAIVNVPGEVLIPKKEQP